MSGFTLPFTPSRAAGLSGKYPVKHQHLQHQQGHLLPVKANTSAQETLNLLLVLRHIVSASDLGVTLENVCCGFQDWDLTVVNSLYCWDNGELPLVVNSYYTQ